MAKFLPGATFLPFEFPRLKMPLAAIREPAVRSCCPHHLLAGVPVGQPSIPGEFMSFAQEDQRQHAVTAFFNHKGIRHTGHLGLYFPQVKARVSIQSIVNFCVLLGFGDPGRGRPVAAKVGYMHETSIEDEKNVYDQMVKKLGAKKKYLLKVRGYNRIFKAHRGVKTDDHHDWIITSVKGVTFRDVLGQPEAESLPHALSAAKCVPSPSSAELLPSHQSG